MMIHHKIELRKKTSRCNIRIISHPRTYAEVPYGLQINKYTIYNYKITFLFDKAVSRWLSKIHLTPKLIDRN